MTDGPVRGAPNRSGRAGFRVSQSITVCPAPAAARRLPSGLNATAYNGSFRFTASSGPLIATG